MDRQFIGREFYLQQIQDHLYHIMSGQPRIVLLEGQAGVGKSRFLQEVLALSQSSGVQICSGYGADTFSRPYEPFSGLFPALQSEGVFSDEQPSATTLLPAVASRVLYESTFDRTPSDQIRLMIDVTSASISLARQAPLMVIVDDLHLADASSLELFDYLAGELTERRDVPILLLGSYRPQLAETPLAALLSRLREQPIAREIELDSFSELETRALVEVVGQQAATQQLVDRVQSVTRGVPFYIEHLMRHFSHQGALVDQGGYLGIRDAGLENSAQLQTPEGVMGPRLASLPEPISDILTVGSFLLEPFSAQMLARAARADALQLEQSLEIARNQGLLIGESDSLHFAHALVRQALQNRLSVSQRQQAHFGIACALEGVDADSRDNNILVIAHHVVQAGCLVEVAHTVAVTQQAGDWAMQVYAWGEAARYYEAACVAMESRGGYSLGDLARYYYQAALAHYRNQDVGPAQERFEQAAQGHVESGNNLGLASALMWLTRLGYMHASTPFGVLPPHTRRLRDVLSDLCDSESVLRGYVMEALAQAYRHGRQTEDANEMAQMALSIGQEQDNPRLRAQASSALAAACAGRLDIATAIENHVIAVDSARQTDDLFLQSRTLSNLPLAHFLIGDFKSVHATATEGVASSRVLQDWAEHSKCLSHLAGVAAVRGEFALVEQLAQESLSMARRSRYPWGAYRALQTWAFALAVRGLRQEADEVLDIITESGSIFSFPGRYEILLTGVLRQLSHLYQGEILNEPIAPLCRAFCQEARSDTYSLAPLCATIELAELSLNPALVDVPVAILSNALEHGVLFTSGWLFSIPRALGVAAVLRQEWEVAAAHFAHALRVTLAVEAWPEYGRACLDYARMTLLIRDRTSYAGAIEAAGQATELLREFGMPLHAEHGATLQKALIHGAL